MLHLQLNTAAVSSLATGVRGGAEGRKGEGGRAGKEVKRSRSASSPSRARRARTRSQRPRGHSIFLLRLAKPAISTSARGCFFVPPPAALGSKRAIRACSLSLSHTSFFGGEGRFHSCQVLPHPPKLPDGNATLPHLPCDSAGFFGVDFKRALKKLTKGDGGHPEGCPHRICHAWLSNTEKGLAAPDRHSGQ